MHLDKTIVISLTSVIMIASACSSQSNQSTESNGTIGNVIYVKPKGVYATIDTNNSIQLDQMLLSKDTAAQKQAIDTILAHPDKYPPIVFYFVSHALMEQGKKDDAVFWFLVGQLRCQFDAKICTDASARSGIGVLEMQFGPEIYPYMRDIRPQLLGIVNKAVDWDERTPYNYDHRWLNLHGLSAMSLSDKEEPKPTKPLSLPEHQWPAIRVALRTQMVENYKTLIAKLDQKQKDLDTPEAKSKRFKTAGYLNYEYGPGIILPLRNGKILCLGGRQYDYRQPEKFVQAADGHRYGHAQGIAELFDPNTGQTTVLGKLPFLFEQDTMASSYRTARGIELNDGRIFVTGKFFDKRPESEWTHKGEPHKPETWIQTLPFANKYKQKLVSITPVSEHNMFGLIYDYRNNSIEIVKSPDDIPPRHMTAMTLLPDGRVLMIGGAIGHEEAYSWRIFPETRVLTYDPKSKALKVVGNLQHARCGHQILQVNDGEYLLFGGYGLAAKDLAAYEASKKFSGPDGLTHDVELFNLHTGKSKIVGQTLEPRHTFCIIPLPNKEVFITGGTTDYRLEDGKGISEIYNISKGTSRYAGEPNAKSPAKFEGGGGASQTLLDGNSLIAVEGSNAYVYNWQDLTKSQPISAPVAESLTKATTGKSIIKDANQRVFVLGGKCSDDPTEYAHWQKNGFEIVEFLGPK